ncbi:MAG: aminoacyl-tRNA hydrolase [Anaerolineae bacterium]|nr:aminoacyl-tRNA hydrolase [Anaerolineae bacterium]
MADKYLIVGLGNPGREYQSNRHNVGFQIVDHLAARHNLAFGKLQSKAFIASGLINGWQVILAKPQSFMNLSGGPVSSLRKFYQIEVERLLVIFDDLDLPVGTLRLRPSGGSGGHNGMKSIIERLGSEDFPRLRIGIDRPPGRMDPAAYVLRNFDQEQLPIIQETYHRAADAVEAWLANGIDLAMNQYNGGVSC